MDEQPSTPSSNVPPVSVSPDPVAPSQLAPSPVPAAPAAPVPPVAAPTATPALSGTPDSWPGAFGVYKYSKQAVKLNLGTLVILWLLDFVLSGVVRLALKNVGEVIALLISSLLTGALTLVLIAGVRGQRKAFGSALSEAVSLWFKLVCLFIVVGLSIVISAVLFIIPFFFVLPRLSLAQYFLVDKRMGVMEAYKASWHATKGNVGKVWGIIGATILMVLLMITIIGIPFSIYFLIMYGGGTAVLYEFLNKNQAAAPVPAVATTPQPPTAVPPTMPSSPMPPAPVVQ